MLVHGFPPISRRDARVLILGSMPGIASLRAGRYYAHPQNTFWRITGRLLGFDPLAPYSTRVLALKASGIAVWDVLASCARASSLDSDIVGDSIVVNDFGAFFARHRRITRVCSNGGTAARLFERHVLRAMPALAAVEHVQLPSTSPANAAIPFDSKLAAWRAITVPFARPIASSAPSSD